jgi:hypothetical protein
VRRRIRRSWSRSRWRSKRRKRRRIRRMKRRRRRRRRRKRRRRRRLRVQKHITYAPALNVLADAVFRSAIPLFDTTDIQKVPTSQPAPTF